MAPGLVLLLALVALQDPGESAVEREELRSLADSLVRGELAAVELDLEDYLAEFPDSRHARLLLGEVRRRQGRYDEAVALMGVPAAPADAALRPDWARAAYDLLSEIGRLKEAEQVLEEALSGDPGNPALRSRQIELWAQTGRRGEAAALLAQLPPVGRGATDDPGLLLEHARALLALGRLQEANRHTVFAEKALRDRRDPRQAEALERLGDHYLMGRSEDGVLALEAYRDALALDAHRPACHVGIARTYLYRMENDKAQRAVQAALSLNPRHPDAFAVAATLDLYERDFGGGLERVAAGLRINPRHREMLALQAAALLLLGRDAGAALQQMEAADPGYAEGWRLIGELQAFHYRFAEAVPYFHKGIAANPDYSLSYFGLARCLANLGELDRALEQMQSFRERDPFRFPWANNLEESLRTVAGLVELRRGRFRFFLHPLEVNVLGPLLADLYRVSWADLSTRYQLEEDDKPIRVEVFSKHNDFSARTVGFIGFGAVGVCFGHTFTLVSPRSEFRGTFQFERTAVHELAHVVSLELSNQRVPRWLTEGMSVYEETRYAAFCDREMDLELFNYFHSGEIIPILDLNRLFGGPRIMFGYYQSGLLCAYIVEQFGQQALVAMLREYARDRTTPQVLEAVLGRTAPQLDAEFLAWLERERIAPLKVQPVYTAHGRERLLERVAGLEAPPAPLLVQVAWAYHTAGRNVDRDDFLHRALQLEPEQPDALFLLAERARRRERGEEAQAYYERAFAAGGEEFFALLRYSDLLLGTAPDRATQERALELLGRARDCFPRYVGPRNPYLMRSEILLALDRTEEAMEELRRYCSIHESDPGPRWSLVAHALAAANHAEAQQYLLELRAIDPFRRDLHRQLATCQRSLAQSSAAIRSLQLALAVDPETEADYDPDLPEEVRRDSDRRERSEIHLELAELYVELGEEESARRSLEEARSLEADAERIRAVEKLLAERQA